MSVGEYAGWRLRRIAAQGDGRAQQGIRNGPGGVEDRIRRNCQRFEVVGCDRTVPKWPPDCRRNAVNRLMDRGSVIPGAPLFVP